MVNSILQSKKCFVYTVISASLIRILRFCVSVQCESVESRKYKKIHEKCVKRILTGLKRDKYQNPRDAKVEWGSGEVIEVDRLTQE